MRVAPEDTMPAQMSVSITITFTYSITDDRVNASVLLHASIPWYVERPAFIHVITFRCLQGTLTRWHVHPAQWIHRLPDDVSFEEGSLCEPLAVALAGIERAGLRLGDPVLIW